MNGRHRLRQTELTEVKRYVPTSVYSGRHNNFHSLEVVGRGRETQLLESDFIFLVSRFNGKQPFIEHLQFVFHVQTHKNALEISFAKKCRREQELTWQL